MARARRSRRRRASARSRASVSIGGKEATGLQQQEICGLYGATPRPRPFRSIPQREDHVTARTPAVFELRLLNVHWPRAAFKIEVGAIKGEAATARKVWSGRKATASQRGVDLALLHRHHAAA